MDPWLFRRISVRYLVDGQAFDVIGRVLHRTNDVVQLMRRDGQIEDVTVVNIIAAREVPDDERRLRPVDEFPAEKLQQIIDHAVGTPPAEAHILIASRQDLAHNADDAGSLSLMSHADETWLRLASTTETSMDSEPETQLPHAYIRAGERAAVRAVVAGDWLGLSPISIADSVASTEVLKQVLAAALAWAEPRGAVYVFALLTSNQDEIAQSLINLGFQDSTGVR